MEKEKKEKRAYKDKRLVSCPNSEGISPLISFPKKFLSI